MYFHKIRIFVRLVGALPAATRKSKTKVSRFMLHVYVGRAGNVRLACGAGRQRLIPRPHSTPFADGPRHAAPRRPSGPTESAKEPNKHTCTQTKAKLGANALGMFLRCKIFHQHYLKINHSYENETGLCKSVKIKCLFLATSD